jgi:membrane protease YdiL (CAAX protease family)
MQFTTLWRRTWPWALLAAIGVIILNLALFSSLEQAFALVPELASLPKPVLYLLATIQPVILVLLASLLGAWLSPRLGLRSYLAGDQDVNLRSQIPLAVGLGLICAIAIIGLDLGTKSLMPPINPDAQELASGLSHQTPLSILASLWYGGITEEVLLRWGIMSGIAGLLAWLFARNSTPANWIYWSAILIAALLFGLGHLPATAQLFGLTPFVIVRAIVLNGIFGVVAGWLFWRRLEAAMIAHMTFHLIVTLLSLN